MGATEDTFAALAAADGFVFTRQARLLWLTNKGHVSPTAERLGAPARGVLRAIYGALGGDEALLAAKRAGRDPEVDFLFARENMIVEVDEIQHFTTDRLRALDLYPADAPTLFDVGSYRNLVARWLQRADRYRTAKPAADFPFAGGRRAQRAYFDAFRDLAAPCFGFRVLRIPAPECDGTLAYERFRDVSVQREPAD